MSYILDALKKSEQERKKGAVPDLNSCQNSLPSPRSTQRALLYLLITTLTVSVLGINLWVLLRQGPEPSGELVVQADSNPSGQEENTAAADSPAALNEGVAGAQSDSATRRESTVAAPPPEHVVIESAELARSAEAAPADPDDQSLDTGSGFDLEPAEPPFEESDGGSGKITVAYADLPGNIRNALPELTIAAHYYSSSPAARMASINGRIMRQGQKTAEGLLLEEINHDGVVFSFDKYRFSLKVFNP
ncbi:MAG: general secretion pathway protein GspB [Desulfobulbales bacterium]|nr:general secretion pathway protein GspB [Desulfobulbales bacterium]